MKKAFVSYCWFPLTFLIALAGGTVFWWFNVPLGWMLGAMVTCLCASLLGVPVVAVRASRGPVIVILGLVLGSSMTPAMIDTAGKILPTLFALSAYIVISGLICVTYLRFVGRFDWTTSYYSGMPGGLNEMVTLGEQRNADIRIIVLVHSGRILFVIGTLPFILALMSDLDPFVRSARPFVPLTWQPEGLFWAAFCAAAGIIVGGWLRLPARFLFGPMIASALVHISGVSDFRAPTLLVNAVQLAMGLMLGCRFAGTSPKLVLRVLSHSVITASLLLAAAFAFSFLLNLYYDYDVLQLILSYSPGGLTEMGLVALTLHLDVGFVVIHHVARIFFVVVIAHLVNQLFLRRGTKPT
ncbi:AbrB family transcriptional regulator [Pseudochelatococcus sp. B33]